MQGKGAGPVNRVELESQVLCAALRQTLFAKDRVGAFTSVKELSHLFPDLLPPPERDDEQANSNKSNYYALLNIKPQTAANGVLAAYLRAVRRFLRTRKVADGRAEYSNILNAGFVLRKPRLRLSHDLVVARRWLHDESRRAAAAADITADRIPVAQPQPASAAPPAIAPAPTPAVPQASSPAPSPQMPPPMPQAPPPLPQAPPVPPVSTPTQAAAAAPGHTAMPSDTVPARAAVVGPQAAPSLTSRSEELPTPKPATAPTPFVEPPPLSPLATKLTQAPAPASANPAAGPLARPITTPEAPPPPQPRYEAMPATSVPKPLPQAEPAEEAAEVLPVAMRAQAYQQEPAAPLRQERPPGRISKTAAFVFDESQLRKPMLPDEKPLPMLVVLLEAAQVIGAMEVQALKAQLERAPNVPVERHIINAGYITQSELDSVRLGENLLQRGKISMAQFQVAFYDERYSGLRMAESLQVRGWLSVEVRNAIDEWKQNSG
jgi:hypothetical protein